MANVPVLDSFVGVQSMSAPARRELAEALKLEIKDYTYTPPPPPTVTDDEELHVYKYGGVLSERGGWFVTKKGDLTHVLRYRQDWMS